MESSGDMNPPPTTQQSHHQQLVEVASPISSRPPSDESISGADEGGVVSGNRWPRQETLALLKIRSEMDATFRDATLKGPLWEHVSRKLGEMGYKRSGKKCKEKFENVHKYYRRTKEGGAATRHHPKTYKFFSELEALQATSISTATVSPLPPPQNPIPVTSPPPSSLPISISANSTSTSPGAGEEDCRKRKRDSNGSMMELLEGKMKEVLERQEAMHQRFLQALEKREQERTVREDAWKRQETARLAREHHLLSQERAASSSRLISLLEKITGQTIPLFPPPPQPKQAVVAEEGMIIMEPSSSLSSRWPKEEVLALIEVRSGMEGRYEEVGAKGRLWEEVSMGMEKKGYKRSSKRCKEKWENINKYFKRVKESSKKRPEDAKTCPYFHQLDALYRKKTMILPQDQQPIKITIDNNNNKPENINVMVEGYDDMINEGEEEDEDDVDVEKNKLKYKIEFQKPLAPNSNQPSSFFPMPMVQ